MSIKLIKAKIAAVREVLKKRQIDAVVVLSADPHGSEYLPRAFAVREALCGFTGSAGTLIIARAGAWLCTDGRYFLQAERELAGSGCELVRSRDFERFLREKFAAEGGAGGAGGAGGGDLGDILGGENQPQKPAKQPKIAISREVCPFSTWQNLSAFAELADDDFTREIAALGEQEFAPITLAERRHESAAQKLAALRKALSGSGFSAHAHLISALDEIAYLCNLRGRDIAHNPFFAAYLLLDGAQVTLFCRLACLGPEARAELEAAGICAREYEQAAAAVAACCRAVVCDYAKTSAKMCEQMRAKCDAPSFVALQKARKSPAEVADILAAHRDDGAALVRFYMRLEREFAGLCGGSAGGSADGAGDGAGAGGGAGGGGSAAVPAGRQVYEAELAEWLTTERAKAADYRGESFAAIVAVDENAAQPHYHAGARGAALQPGGVLLIDSGAQYERGTTDVTRVMVLGGTPPRGFCEAYTAVLCAHIRMARLVFPAGTPGALIDAIARAPLWERGLDYAHGTGHGVGNFLAVHEGPQTLSLQSSAAARGGFCTGMLTSVEPGVYHAGRWGIRLENLYFCREKLRSEYGEFLEFFPATMYPFEREYIDAAMLSAAELEWLNDYHSQVLRELSPLLSPAEREWLAAKCARI